MTCHWDVEANLWKRKTTSTKGFRGNNNTKSGCGEEWEAWKWRNHFNCQRGAKTPQHHLKKQKTAWKRGWKKQQLWNVYSSRIHKSTIAFFVFFTCCTLHQGGCGFDPRCTWDFGLLILSVWVLQTPPKVWEKKKKKHATWGESEALNWPNCCLSLSVAPCAQSDPTLERWLLGLSPADPWAQEGQVSKMESSMDGCSALWDGVTFDNQSLPSAVPVQQQASRLSAAAVVTVWRTCLTYLWRSASLHIWLLH